jgi:hypothetical protein
MDFSRAPVFNDEVNEPNQQESRLFENKPKTSAKDMKQIIKENAEKARIRKMNEEKEREESRKRAMAKAELIAQQQDKSQGIHNKQRWNTKKPSFSSAPLHNKSSTELVNEINCISKTMVDIKSNDISSIEKHVGDLILENEKRKIPIITHNSLSIFSHYEEIQNSLFTTTFSSSFQENVPIININENDLMVKFQEILLLSTSFYECLEKNHKTFLD